MTNFATIQDLQTLWRAMTPSETTRASELLNVVSAMLRYEAEKNHKDLDAMIAQSNVLGDVARSVTVDIVSRALMTSTDQEPMTQFSESALGYTMSGSFLSPGGGIFIKKSELDRLGIGKKSRVWSIDAC